MKKLGFREGQDVAQQVLEEEAGLKPDLLASVFFLLSPATVRVYQIAWPLGSALLCSCGDDVF